MNLLFYSAITSLVLTFLLMPLFVKFLMRIQILDKGGRRKIHKGVTPSMGGLIIFISFLFALIVWRPGIIMNENGRFLMSSLTLMVLTGIRDDIVPLPAFIKLLVQAIAASIAVLIMNIRIDSLYGLFGINEISTWMSYILSMFFILFITNAFNLIDGIDGLAGSIAFFCLSFLSLWNYWTGHVDQAILLSCCVGAIVGFLYYNWQPASIFMGDTGSLMLGFIIAISTLDFITHNGALPVNSAYKFHAVLSAGVAIVLLPIFDTTRVFLLRLSQRRSPFNPDRQHTHHALIHRVSTHAKATLIILLAYILLSGIVLFISLKNLLPDWVLLLSLAATLILIDRVLHYSLTNLRKK